VYITYRVLEPSRRIIPFQSNVTKYVIATLKVHYHTIKDSLTDMRKCIVQPTKIMIACHLLPVGCLLAIFYVLLLLR